MLVNNMLRKTQALFRVVELFNSLDIKSYLPRITALVICCFATVSCGEITMEDISSNPEYATIIGKKIRAKTELWATGVTLDQNYKKQIDCIVLVPGVGFTGPEVISRGRVKTGSVFGIAGVLKTKSIINPTKYYLVKEVGSNTYKDIPMWVMIPGAIKDGNYGLNESVYEKID